MLGNIEYPVGWFGGASVDRFFDHSKRQSVNIVQAIFRSVAHSIDEIS
jgi:hypothetical protein